MAGSPFGSRLRELRQAAELSQQALADRAGISLGSVVKIEQGLRPNPAWLTVCALADALGVEIAAFRAPPAKVYVAPEGRPPTTTEKPAKKRKGNK